MFKKRLAEIEARKLEIRTLLEGDKETNLEEIQTELENLEAEERALQAKTEMLSRIQTGEVATRTLGIMRVPGAEPVSQRGVVTTDSLEYRQAFMDYALRGTKSDILTRANATTFTTDIGTVIPNTILNQIIEKMTAYGMIYNRVTKTNVKGGLSIPTSSAKPVATWTAEGSVSDKQKKTTGNITFSYHKLQCRVAVTLEADTVSLDIFEATIVNNIYEAMIVALENGIVSGTGTNQPLGIVNDTQLKAAQKLAVAVANVSKLDTWTDILSKIPLSYEAKVSIVLTKVDFEKYLAGMVDSNGQPIARVNYGLANRPERRFLGYEVILVEDYLPTIDAAATGKTFGIIGDLSAYYLNSNMAMTYRRYFDEDTDEWIDKATLIADGKLADPNSILLLNKATA